MAEAVSALAQALASPGSIPLASILGQAYDAWQRGSNNYPQQLGSNPLSLSNLGQTWQSTPGLSMAQGFAPADIGAIGSIAAAPARGVLSSTALNQLAEKSPFADRKITKLAEKAEEAHDSFKMHMDDAPPHEDDAIVNFLEENDLSPETDEEAMKAWRESPEHDEYHSSLAEHTQEANKLAQDYQDAMTKYSNALQDHVSWMGSLAGPK